MNNFIFFIKVYLNIKSMLFVYLFQLLIILSMNVPGGNF